ncbi:MAG TPA: S1/P1 nuclease [Stellaceae bacterium]|nr:S1/P1 nuclease [Stellaceae bacterium]
MARGRSIGHWLGFGAACAVALLLPLQSALAWGPEGHRVIALVAEHVLQRSDPAALAKVSALLATDRDDRLSKTDIASEANWADVLAEKSPEARTATTAWHFTRINADSPDLARACFDHPPLPPGYPASHGPQNNCSADKVAQFAAELRAPATSPHERLAAVQFLLNLVGDLHDPMHAIDHGDQGGRCVALQIGSKPPVRLSTYWEETLVREVAGSDAAGGAAHIAAAIPAGETARWAEGDPAAWALETFRLAKSVAYSFTAGKPTGTHDFPAVKGQPAVCASVPLYRVGPEYETKALATVRERLAVAGVRLARLLRGTVK